MNTQPVNPNKSHSPYDPTVFKRMAEQLDDKGFYRAPDGSPQLPQPSSIEIALPPRLQLRARAARYLQVIGLAGKKVLEESEAGVGTPEAYRRSSMPKTHKKGIEKKILRHTSNFDRDGAWKQMFWEPDTVVTGAQEFAPRTQTERGAVDRMERARRDAAVSAREVQILRTEGSFRQLGLVALKYAYHKKRYAKNMNKAGKIADARDIRGLVARAVVRTKRNR